MAEQLLTMTSTRALIKVNGKTIGFIRNLRVSETIQRGSVMGLGTMFESERPPLKFSGTWQCDQYMISLKDSGIPGLDVRTVTTPEIWQNTQTLLQRAVDIVVNKKNAKVLDESGNVVESISEDAFATIKDVYLDSMSFDISEGAVSNYNQSGVYTQPCLTSAL